MKKVAALGLVAAMAITGLGAFAGCDNGSVDKDTITVGFIALHDDQSTYDKNFLDAIREACANKGIPSDQLKIVTGIGEDNSCYEAAADLVDQGCDVIFADSFGHENFIIQAAREFTDVQFCHATGTQAHTVNLSNFHNAFASIYEGRYLAGVAAGMKLVEMMNAGELTEKNYDDDGNIKIGYVGAYTYAEVISGYTSFFLGAKSIVEEQTDVSISMEVQFTGTWYDEPKERNAAINLIEHGAALISQHADSLGAPSACEDAGVPNVSYNGSTASTCPNTFIVSSRIDWVPYFEYMIDCVTQKKAIDTDWTGTIQTGSVALTALGTAAAEGTQEKMDEVKAKLISGEIKVFDCSTFTVNNGETLTSYMADVDTDAAFTPDTEVISNGVFCESAFRSAPYFNVQIDGITLLNSEF